MAQTNDETGSDGPTARTVPVVSAEQVLAAQGDQSPIVIDLRSPSEFALDHVPGAHNLPLFDDVERAVIGTLYARRSPESAFTEGSARTVSRIEDLVASIGRVANWEVPDVDLRARVRAFTSDGIEALERGLTTERCDELPPRPVVLGCWRGGLRSRSVVALLREVGLSRAVALDGGYKSYRSHVRRRVEGWAAPDTYVLRGLTGVGKTLVLREIETLRPGWTLDLEGLAGHRSSILGMVGLEPCNQKTFESRLRARIDLGFPGPCVVEGESRKVGDVILPAAVWQTLVGGMGIELVATREQRVDVLIADYLERDENREHLARQLNLIEVRLEMQAGDLSRLLRERRERELVELLLERYYDPLYRHSEGKHTYATTIAVTDAKLAAGDIVRWIEAAV